jgi:hypothetical protein
LNHRRSGFVSLQAFAPRLAITLPGSDSVDRVLGFYSGRSDKCNDPANLRYSSEAGIFSSSSTNRSSQFSRADLSATRGHPSLVHYLGHKGITRVVRASPSDRYSNFQRGCLWTSQSARLFLRVISLIQLPNAFSQVLSEWNMIGIGPIDFTQPDRPLRQIYLSKSTRKERGKS